MSFVVINGDPNATIVREKTSKEFKAWPHHCQPLTVLQIIVVVLERGAAGIVGWIDVDAFHAACVVGEECFQRLKVVTLNEHV